MAAESMSSAESGGGNELVVTVEIKLAASAVISIPIPPIVEIRMDISTSIQHITFPTNPPTRARFGHSQRQTSQRPRTSFPHATRDSLPSQHRLLILHCARDHPLYTTPKTACSTQTRTNSTRSSPPVSLSVPRVLSMSLVRADVQSGDARRLFGFTIPW